MGPPSSSSNIFLTSDSEIGGTSSCSLDNLLFSYNGITKNCFKEYIYKSIIFNYFIEFTV